MVGEAEITMRGAADRAGKGRATAMPSTDPSIIRVSNIGTAGANPAECRYPLMNRPDVLVHHELIY